MWKLCIDAPRADLEIFENALADHLASSALFEVDERANTWQLEGLFIHEDQGPQILQQIQDVACGHDRPMPAIRISTLPEKDWLAENRASFAPIAVGAFYIHSSYDLTPPPPGKTVFQIDASLAFGTGAHHTTQGCLMALEHLAQQGDAFHQVLDLGTGSGILAMAAAELFQAPILATDIDPDALAVAHDNVIQNGYADRVTCLVSDGFAHPEIQQRQPFDLIVANILAAPLIALSAPITAHLGPQGVLILSGLLQEQAADVLTAYTDRGMALARHDTLGDWSILTLHKPASDL